MSDDLYKLGDLIARTRESLDLLEMLVISEVECPRLHTAVEQFDKDVEELMIANKNEERFQAAGIMAANLTNWLDDLIGAAGDENGGVSIPLSDYHLAQATLGKPFLSETEYRLFVMALSDRFALSE